MLLARLLGQHARKRIYAGSVRTCNAIESLNPFSWRTSERLLIAPQDLRITDPTVASDIYGGIYTFKGQTVFCQGRSPFDVVPPSLVWGEELYSFSWLRHLCGQTTPLTRVHARTLLKDFLNSRHKRTPYTHTPSILARRLISLLTQSPVLLEDVDREFYRKFMTYCSRTMHQLKQALRYPLSPYERTHVLTALAYGGLCLEGKEKSLKKTTPLLSGAIADTILPDGGHITRNPQCILDHLLDFLPLQHLYQARNLPVPEELARAIEHIFPMLRLLRHPDGSLALFNGIGNSSPGLITATFAYDNIHRPPLQNAPYSGYERVNQGTLSLIADVGVPPLKFQPVYAGCLSFECSVGPSRMVTNCGTPSLVNLRDLLAPRLTAAHSTATLNGESSCIFASDSKTLPRFYHRIIRALGDPGLTGPTSVPFTRETTPDGGIRLTATHDGYQTRFGVSHQRSWYLSKNGDRLEGEDAFLNDALLPSGTLYTTLRFHLHPSVEAEMDPKNGFIRLTLAHGAIWYFTVDYGTLALEDSVFLAAPEGVRKTKHIVVSFYVAERPVVRWCFLTGKIPKESRSSADHIFQGIKQKTVLENGDGLPSHSRELDSVE